MLQPDRKKRASTSLIKKGTSGKKRQNKIPLNSVKFRDLVRLKVMGASNVTVGRKLKIHEKTVKKYMQTADYKKCYQEFEDEEKKKRDAKRRKEKHKKRPVEKSAYLMRENMSQRVAIKKF